MRRALRRNVPTGAPETEKPAGCRIAFGNSTRGNDSSPVGTSCRTNETSSVGRRCLILARSATDQSLSKSIHPPLANEQAHLPGQRRLIHFFTRLWMTRTVGEPASVLNSVGRFFPSGSKQTFSVSPLIS